MRLRDYIKKEEIHKELPHTRQFFVVDQITEAAERENAMLSVLKPTKHQLFFSWITTSASGVTNTVCWLS